MFCKNCGSPMNDNAAVCVSCGVAKGAGNNFCFNCGSKVDPSVAVCMNCGAPINGLVAAPNAKSKMAAGLLGIFLGALGVHNFYLGYTGRAVAQLLISVLSCGTLAVVSEVWGLIEGIMILCGNINTDGNGNPLGE